MKTKGIAKGRNAKVAASDGWREKNVEPLHVGRLHVWRKRKKEHHTGVKRTGGGGRKCGKQRCYGRAFLEVWQGKELARNFGDLWQIQELERGSFVVDYSG